MTKTITRSIKNLTTVAALFCNQSTDQFYNDIKCNQLPWSEAAKEYWQDLYNLYRVMLDSDFVTALSKDSFSGIWELTIVHFLSSHHEKGLNLISHKKKSSIPDFCADILGSRFYFEAICVSPGNIPELKVTLSEVSGKARRTPVAENMERLTAAIREKGHTKYYGEKACGYKCAMEDGSGLVIAISIAKIQFHNRSNNFIEDLRCIFGISSMKIPLAQDSNRHYKMGTPYHEQQLTFEKTSNKEMENKRGSPLKMDYFANDEYAHISAMLLSYDGRVFFPNIEIFDGILWNECRNDFILIHNPFAKNPLPVGFFDVSLEVTATHADNKMTLNMHKPKVN